MRRLIYPLFISLFLVTFIVKGQNLYVTTLIDSIKGSGGLTTDHQGNLYISDFGPMLGNPESSTSIYKLDIRTGELTEYASGFLGASGSFLDDQGVFYQSNPFGHRISRISPDGTVDLEWAQGSLKTPIGLERDKDGNVYVCNCGLNNIGKISSEGKYAVFAGSDLFKCPNGLTQDDAGNLYACNFSDGKVLKIDKSGAVSLIAELPILDGESRDVGNGHLIWKNGWLFVATIGAGEIYRVGPEGKTLKIAGQSFAFTNQDGIASEATFNKPNGITASITGDTLYVAVSGDSWEENPLSLHPVSIRMITGVCSLPDSNCD